jgi:purine nucleosidase
MADALARRPFLIDTDTASDDAVALAMALRHPGVDVRAITVVAGNVPLEMGVQNALYTVELCGRTDVPVYAGAAEPLARPLETAQFVHGADGMGDIGLPLTGRVPAPGHAVEVMNRLAHEHAGELTLVTLGPLTNVALAVQADPQFATRVGRCVVMGAVADHIGNVTPVAEFNMWVDPEAVEVVLGARLPLQFVGWDISRHYAVIDDAEAAALRGFGTPLAEFCVDIQGCVRAFCATETKLDGFDLPDPIAMAVALEPAVAIETRRWHLAVETGSPLTRGMVVMDVLGLTGAVPNATVVTVADAALFRALLRAALT